MTLWEELKGLLTDAATLENQDCTLLPVLKFHHHSPGEGNGQMRQARDIYPGCLALLPHPFLIPYLGNTNSFQDSTLYPNFHKHDLPSLCWSQKMTALGWAIWNCHFYRSKVVECRQFNLMVIIYIRGVQFVKYIYFHYLLNLQKRNVR